MVSLPTDGAPSLFLPFLLVWTSSISVASSKEEAVAVPELSPEEYFATLQASKASLVYFQKDGNALLFNEVKYVMTLVDLQKLEDSLRGQADLVFAYVQAIGTTEHRALMETAFVYGSFKFALTTEVTLLRGI
ncbi:hypothetical protein JRQ81_001338, partial [Phrynocephalus forsythii]